ncbi:MAG TPA: TetR/AcrR family transcriptional regulator [Acidimicrobiia bacterium]|nr:TetR/AcrR family transcriptional regulator [Acidimicrobiia bacterium]
MPGRTPQQVQVLDAAVRLFADRGFDDVTMADIADAAGVARATVFNYFGSKHGVVEAVTESVIVYYRELLDQALADDETPAPVLLRWLFEEMGTGIETQRRFFRGVFREIARIGLGFDEGGVTQRAEEDASTRLEQLIERGQARGELNDTFEAKVLALAFRALANGTINNWLYDDASEPLTVRMGAVVDIFLSPIAVPTMERGAR